MSGRPEGSPAARDPTTRIARTTAEDVFVRGRSLTRELIGNVTFTEMAFLQITGVMPTPAQTAVVDACLVSLVEHGLTPGAIASRLVYSSAPEAMQGAVAAGLLSVGSVFVGTVEGCAAIVARLVRSADADSEARAVVLEHRTAGRRVPGFGHPQHKPDDPRPPRIFAVAERHGVAGAHIEALHVLAAAVDAAHGKHVTINATGAIAAALGDCGVDPRIMRGFAILARCAGIVGHVHEEQGRPAIRALLGAADEALPYEEP